MWRGVGNANWRLDSTMARRLMDGYGLTEPRVADTERELIERARHRGFDVVDGRLLSDFELLALLRHHGAATRLVDFTRSAAVGLWFATVEEPKSPGWLLGIHSDFLHGYEGVPLTKTYDEMVSDLSKYEGPWTWDPSPVSPRVTAQHSQFVFSTIDEESPVGSLQLPQQAGAVIAVEIPAIVKGAALGFLRTVLDIGSQTMFPDISGFSQAFGVDPPESPYRW